MAYLRSGASRAPQIFFSYSSQSRKFVSDFARYTGFRRILACKIWDYVDAPVSVGGLRDGLEKRVSDSDAIVAFISGDYSSSANSMFEFDLAVRLVTDRPATSRLVEMAFLVLDADGAAWWDTRRRQPDMQARWPDPVWLDCSNELGTAPADVATPDLTRKVNSLAGQLRARLIETSAGPPEPQVDRHPPTG
jgi:hypothetical protein